MDAVISYVNCNEPVWRAEFDKYCTDFESKKFFYYDWGTLKYVLRGISLYMPYIKNVFLIVSNIEQVPDYVDQTKVKIVLHKDIIPEEYLPTFNSCTIETFMHRIQGLDNEFVYFNDDTLPISPIAYSDLISDGKPCMSFEKNEYDNKRPAYYLVDNIFWYACIYVNCKQSFSIDVIKNPLEYEGDGFCQIHGPSVFLRDKNEDIFNTLQKYFLKSITRERDVTNISQWIFSDVMYLENNYIESKLELSYIHSTKLNKETCIEQILSSNGNFLCINDAGPIPRLTYDESIKLIQESLEIKMKVSS